MQHRAPLAALEDRYGKVGTEVERNERRLGALEGARIEMQRERAELAAQLETQEPKTPLFAKLKVASPCTASWEKMKGSDRVRFCGECKKNVYNVSEMTRREAEALLQKNADEDGDMCVRFYERADGTILTQDCPVGVTRKERRKLALAVIGGTAMWGVGVTSAFSLVSSLVRSDEPAQEMQTLDMSQPVQPGHLRVNGEMGSTVSVDGELNAILPAFAFSLRPGKHFVRITHPDGNDTETHEIDVLPGMMIEINQRAQVRVPVPVLPPDGRHVAGGLRARTPVPNPIKHRF